MIPEDCNLVAGLYDGQVAYFDGDKGYVYMMGNSDCYDILLEDIEEIVAPAFTDYQNGDTEDLRDDFYFRYGRFKEYSDGYMLVVAWKWRIDAVYDEQSAGVCL